MKYLTTRIPALSGIILLAAVMVFLPASCQNESDPGGSPQIPAALQNTEWVNQDGDSVSFSKDSVTVKPSSGQQQTFALKDSQYVAETSQTTLFFSDDKTKDQIVFRNGSITMVNLGGVNKPTANWNDKNDAGTGVSGDFEYSYTSSSVTITGYTGNGGDVIIPPVIGGRPVKAISDAPEDPYQPDRYYTDRAVFYKKNLDSIVIPDSITYIGIHAFNNAFNYNNENNSLVIPNSVTYIGEYAFWGNGFKSIILPDSITSIERNTFGVNKLTNLSIPDSVTSIGAGAFTGNPIPHVIIPSSVTFIGASCFEANEVFKVTIGANVSFGDYDESEKAGIVPGDFNKVYFDNGKQAGTYTRQVYHGQVYHLKWTKQ